MEKFQLNIDETSLNVDQKNGQIRSPLYNADQKMVRLIEKNTELINFCLGNLERL